MLSVFKSKAAVLTASIIVGAGLGGAAIANAASVPTPDSSASATTLPADPAVGSQSSDTTASGDIRIDPIPSSDPTAITQPAPNFSVGDDESDDQGDDDSATLQDDDSSNGQDSGLDSSDDSEDSDD